MGRDTSRACLRLAPIGPNRFRRSLRRHKLWISLPSRGRRHSRTSPNPSLNSRPYPGPQLGRRLLGRQSPADLKFNPSRRSIARASSRSYRAQIPRELPFLRLCLLRFRQRSIPPRQSSLARRSVVLERRPWNRRGPPACRFWWARFPDFGGFIKIPKASKDMWRLDPLVRSAWYCLRRLGLHWRGALWTSELG